MKVIHIKERGGDELHEYKKALWKLKEAKDAIDTIFDLTEEMEDEFGISERRDYGSRYRDPDYPMHERGYYYGRDWDGEMRERRRMSNGRYY